MTASRFQAEVQIVCRQMLTMNFVRQFAPSSGSYDARSPPRIDRVSRARANANRRQTTSGQKLLHAINQRNNNPRHRQLFRRTQRGRIGLPHPDERRGLSILCFAPQIQHLRSGGARADLAAELWFGQSPFLEEGLQNPRRLAPRLLGTEAFAPALALAVFPVQKPTSAEIGDATRRCLARISQGSTPLGVIAEFLGELRVQGWDDASIRTVDATVRKVLMGLFDPDSDPTAVS